MTYQTLFCFPPAVVAFILITVPHSEATTCYSCRSESEDGCKPAEGKVVNCDSLLPISNMKADERNLIEILRIMTKKEQAYIYDNEYEDLATELLGHVDDIEDLLNLKPTSDGREELAQFNAKRHKAVVMYKGILAKWRKEDAMKTKALWAKIMRNVTALKKRWTGVDEMPEPPKRSNRYFAYRILEYNEYKEMMGEWLQAAEKQIHEGTCIADFDNPIQYKWRKGYDEYLYMSASEIHAAEQEMLTFEDLPVDGKWCASFQSRLKVTRGCGVKMVGLRFEKGCHNMTGKHREVTYCRCEGGSPCLQENQQDYGSN